ncbi:unnamed protein product [Paramecium pentaurelia]|uniref:Epsilon tubulin n=1 Tax=Paramecium pentaurelia TaxID=43138 RepID=A0A8S1UFD6_9CILI|nr:unnamed protein product [Paramecium pentaurelia]
MPRELVFVQVGQCGNQIGMRFWDLALKEHAKAKQSLLYDESLSSFFRNVNSKNQELKIGDPIQNLKARALIVDMEEGVINQIMKSPLGELFEERQCINDVSGAGNNWAHGFYHYGNQYEKHIEERLRKTVEQCDSLQCFFMTHSIGGGTGSGLGSRILGLLEDNYPEVFRFTASVFPSGDDDVVTSPYNSLFSLYELAKHADCVFPIDNQALINIVDQIDKPNKARLVKENAHEGSVGIKITQFGEEEKRQKPFDKMNSLIAHLLSHITCSMRFEGALNVDLNEITMNLVPYPDLHFLISSMAPLYSLLDSKLQPRRLDQMFSDIYHPDFQMITGQPSLHKYLAVGLLVRGDVAFSDVNRNIKKLKDQLKMIYWNQEGFKYGICNQPPIGQQYSMLCLANNTCIKDTFQEMTDRFQKLYKRKVYVHHYKQYMEQSHFDETLNGIQNLMVKYQDLEMAQPKKYQRIQPIF